MAPHKESIKNILKLSRIKHNKRTGVKRLDSLSFSLLR
jgi:hypothetical protein